MSEESDKTVLLLVERNIELEEEVTRMSRHEEKLAAQVKFLMGKLEEAKAESAT